MCTVWTLSQAMLLDDLVNLRVLEGTHASFSEPGLEPANALCDL